MDPLPGRSRVGWKIYFRILESSYRQVELPVNFKENYSPKEENFFSRQILATALTGWSLGIQKDLTSAIADLNLPILWMTGESDQKFTSIGKHLKFSHSLSRQCVIKDAAHRVPWDNSSEFLEEMCDYLSRITKKEIQ